MASLANKVCVRVPNVKQFGTSICFVCDLFLFVPIIFLFGLIWLNVPVRFHTILFSRYFTLRSLRLVSGTALCSGLFSYAYGRVMCPIALVCQLWLVGWLACWLVGGHWLMAYANKAIYSFSLSFWESLSHITSGRWIGVWRQRLAKCNFFVGLLCVAVWSQRARSKLNAGN